MRRPETRRRYRKGKYRRSSCRAQVLDSALRTYIRMRDAGIDDATAGESLVATYDLSATEIESLEDSIANLREDFA
jgi:hypothetical protein